MHWGQFRGLLQKYLGIPTISIVWISSIFDCQYEKLCHLYKLVHGLSILPNSCNTTSSSLSYHTHSNHILSLHVPSSHTNAYYYSFFVMPYVPGTYYLTLLCHYLALKGLYLITYNYYCACTLLFLTLGCILVRINTTLLLFMYPLFFSMN